MHKLYTDGTYQSNLDCAGIGGYIRLEHTLIASFSEIVKEPEHFNHHEHRAVIYGLEKALELGIYDIEAYSDMDYYSKHLNQDLNLFLPSQSNPFNYELVMKIIELTKKFNHITFYYVPREKNIKAHKLAGQAYRQLEAKFSVEPVHKSRKTKELNIIHNFSFFSDATKALTFFTFDTHVEICLMDRLTGDTKNIRLMRYPFKKDIVNAIKELTKNCTDKINYYQDRESDFLMTILFTPD